MSSCGGLEGGAAGVGLQRSSGQWLGSSTTLPDSCSMYSSTDRPRAAAAFLASAGCDVLLLRGRGGGSPWTMRASLLGFGAATIWRFRAGGRSVAGVCGVGYERSFMGNANNFQSKIVDNLHGTSYILRGCPPSAIQEDV